MSAAAAGWNQFYLYQSPSSVSRNPPHTTEQPEGKLMCFPIMKRNTAKISLKRCLGGLPQQYSAVSISGVTFKHIRGTAYMPAKEIEFISGVDVYRLWDWGVEGDPNIFI